VQSLFGERYGVASAEYDGVFDLLWEDDAVFWVGGLRAQVVHLPGHTPDHVGYWIGGEFLVSFVERSSVCCVVAGGDANGRGDLR
jgi:glyoxylase-like metal-dependent hydrolase (beta-lactamase superfamily II)